MFQKVQSGSTEDSKLEGSKSGHGVPVKKLLYSSRQKRMVIGPNVCWCIRE